MKNYDTIIETIETAALGFEVQTGISPNKIIVSEDVFNYLCSIDMVVGSMVEPQRIMGMVIEVVFDKELFIEVGYMGSAKSYQGGE